jgi:signal peptidase I
MTWQWKFYNILDRSEKRWFWGTSLFNLLLLIIFLAVGYYVFASFLFFLMWEVMICLYYITKDKSGKKKSASKEWWDAILFAVIAATLIRTFFFEAYTIPTASMEKTLLVNDFLFVGKCNYGARLPMTPLAIPFIHNKIPGTDLPSYISWPQTGYHRLPALEDIKRNDIVVFNFPVEGDSRYDEFTMYEDNPVDKKVNYVKRCVGMPGDTIELKESRITINGQPQPQFKHWQFSVRITLSQKAIQYYGSQRVHSMYSAEPMPFPFSLKALQKHHIAVDDIRPEDESGLNWLIFIDPARVQELYDITEIDKVYLDTFEKPGVADMFMKVYPRSHKVNWNKDYFGPFYIPKKGATIQMNEMNYVMYEKVIRDYEKNKTLEWKDGKVLIEGKPVTEYTFKQNYYMMIGDNRHNSSDGRMWGVVPEENIVGKALIIWFSYDKDASNFFTGIRWKRLFTIIHNID